MLPLQAGSVKPDSSATKFLFEYTTIDYNKRFAETTQHGRYHSAVLVAAAPRLIQAINSNDQRGGRQMLYDPKWEQQTKADPCTLESLIAWLEKQPPKGLYDYWSCCGKCLFDRYHFTHFGRKSTSYTEYAKLCECCGSDIASTEPYTFGAALKRARAKLAKRV